ncbi:MAG TPA: glycosyltransferase family 2 protein [Pantanalinema sp.]
MTVPKVSLIVLNYNGGDYLEACLDSLRAQTYRDFELIVVDNASVDGSWELIEAQRDALGFHAIRNEQNLGYSEGNNVGIRAARGEYVLVLNNDTVCEPAWLETLMREAEARPDWDMFACQIRSFDRRDTLDTIGIIVYRDGMSRGLGRLEPAAAYAEAREVFAPSGCAGLYRRGALERVGAFPSEFFAYCEDMDLGMRIRLSGGRCWYVPDAVVYHHYSATAGKYSPLKAYLVERNHLWVRLRTFPLGMLLLSPCYTFWRYLLQAYGVLAKKGASGQFASQAPAGGLVLILLRAYFHTLLALPRLIAERRRIRRLRAVSSREVSSWFDRFGISARELALKE